MRAVVPKGEALLRQHAPANLDSPRGQKSSNMAMMTTTEQIKKFTSRQRSMLHTLSHRYTCLPLELTLP